MERRMYARFKHGFFNYKHLLLLLIGVAITVLAIINLSRYFRHFYRQHYKIGVIINSVELDPVDYKVIKNIIADKLHAVNESGGINGRPVDALYLDDKSDPELLKKLVTQSIQDTSLIAYVGCRSSTRAIAIAPILAKNQVALIGGYSLTNLTRPYPNMYSGEIGINDLQYLLTKLLESNARRSAFIGKKGDLYSEMLLKIMEDYALKNPGFTITSRYWFDMDHNFSKNEIRKLSKELEQGSDFLVLSIEQGKTNELLMALWKNGYTAPVFCGLADVAQINAQSVLYKRATLFDFNPLGIPGVLNMRLQQQLAAFRKDLKEGQKLDFQLSLGGRTADEIGLIQEAASDHDQGNNSARNKVNAGLKKFIGGKKIYRGWFADWYFTEDRGFGGEPLLAWKPTGFNSPMLAPVQYLRTDSGYRNAPVVYLNIDLENISQIDDEEGTFYASFYLELSSAVDFNLTEIEFTNASKNKIDQKPLIATKLIRHTFDSVNYNFNSYLYKVSGKFRFNPDLKKYPFDSQHFPIEIQPANALFPFLVQPPEQAMIDTVFESPGWIFRNNYVGFDQEIVSVENIFENDLQLIPYYKFSYVYEMKRARIDFSLKTLVPLLAILIITYLSAYIPHREFESLCALQVTALLAAIALYFSTFKPELQYATISDMIFIFSYVMITSIMGTSILIYTMYRKDKTIKTVARFYQRVIFSGCCDSLHLFYPFLTDAP